MIFERDSTGGRAEGKSDLNEIKTRPYSLPWTAIYFLVWMFVLHGLYQLYWHFYPLPLREETASLVSYLLNWADVANVVQGRFIFFDFGKWVVTSECTAINAVFLFASFILAFSSSFQAKLLALFIGIPFIFLANITRLVALGLFSSRWPSYAHILHDYIWEIAFLLLVVSLWMTWLKLLVKYDTNPKAVS